MLGGKKLGKSKGRSSGKWIHKDDVQKRVFESELDEYLNNGWSLGYCEKAKKNLSVSHLGNVPWNKGIHISEETRAKVSESTKEAMTRPEIREKLTAKNELYKGSRWMIKDDTCMLVLKDDIQSYLNGN